MGIYLPFARLLLFLSFFYFFFLLLLLLPQIQAAQESHICLHDQKSALLQFRHEFIITDNISFSSWEPQTDCCSWDGVTCNVTTGYVIGLDLNNSIGFSSDIISYKVSGPIYSNSSLFGLHHLQRLNLAYNDFKLAPIPSGFDRLPSLTHLNLSYSNFSGRIPWEFSRLTRLVSLHLSTFRFNFYDYYCYNFNICHRLLKLERPNLKELIQNLTSLVELYLDGVDLSSPSSSPTQGSSDHWSQVLPQSLPNLRSLSLSGCGLSGPIHPSFSQLVFLEELRLDGNYNLSLEAPNFLPLNFSHFKTLSLSSCGLYGEFPSSFFGLPNLQILDVSENSLLNGQLPDFPLNNSFQFISLSDTNFSGAIPDSIGNLRFLTTLRLGNCNFSGSIPPSLTNLTQLTELDLSSNSFTGSVPMFNKDNVPNLAFLDLSDNLLDGTIHSSLFTLPSLQVLWLSNNQLSGRLDLDQLFHNSSLSSSLEFMDLGGNKLNGQIPKSISQFSSLQSLYLSSNDFSGTVKLEDMFGNLENLSSLHLSNNNLLSLEFGNTSSSFRPQFSQLDLGSCHIKEFPSFLRTQEQLEYLDLSNNTISGQVPNWIWKKQLQYLNLSYNSLNTLERPLLLNFDSSSLSTLDLRNNKLKGSLQIPASSVTFFSISNNSFVGEIPEAICKLSDLLVFDASHNNLSGSILECLGNISTLSVLDVQGNRFHGMPQNFTNASSLRTLKMNGNILEGQVPRSLANCTSLEVLDLGKNKMFGTFPFWLGKLPKLRVLVLHSNRFCGPIQHPPTLNEFPMLQIMDLSSNTFTGNFPIEYFRSFKEMMFKKENNSKPQYIGDFYYKDSVTIMNKGLEMEVVRILTIYTALDLSNNRFQGEIPKVIGELTSLVVLNMSQNDLVGQIPSSIGNMAELESLDFSGNKLSGKIPESICKLSGLQVFDASHNNLSGSIPECLGNIDTLLVLDVQGNRFHGMPQNFTNARSLRTLKMNGNILEGQVPRSLANCTSLEVLDLGKNKMFDTFPFWLGKLPMLRVLVLHSNRFYGPIKHARTLDEFPMLQILDLSSNTFTGNFPIEYFGSLKAMMFKKGNKSEPQYIGESYYRDSVTIMNKGLEMELVRILTIYTALDLSNNRFQGEIPKVIGELTSLVVLNMSHNDLVGQIPSSIGNMAELESLDFSGNKLSGQIPRQLANLTFLEFLNLSQNHLEGPIPRGNQLETFLNTSYIQNPRLCGFPLSRKCKDNSDDMPPQGPQGERSTNDSQFDWKFMLMGYGCGMVIGFVIGYIIFKDEWLIRIFRLAPIGRRRKSKGGRLRR